MIDVESKLIVHQLQDEKKPSIEINPRRIGFESTNCFFTFDVKSQSQQKLQSYVSASREKKISQKVIFNQVVDVIKLFWELLGAA